MLYPTHPESRLSSIIHRADATVVLLSTLHLPLISQLARQTVAVGPQLIPILFLTTPLDLIEIRRHQCTWYLHPVALVFPRTLSCLTQIFYPTKPIKQSNLGFNLVPELTTVLTTSFISLYIIRLWVLLKVDQTKAAILYRTISVSRLLQPAQLPLDKTIVSELS